VLQGGLGDCYFVQSASGYSQHSYGSNSRISNLVDPITDLSKGLFVINAFIRGVKSRITVDDFLPKNGGNMAFAGISSGGAMWPVLLEKAFAKARGNYEIIEGGNQNEASSFLSGSPSDYFMWSTATWVGSAAWTIMNNGFTGKYVMSLSTPSTGSDSQAGAKGLPLNHAFTVLGTYSLYDSGSNLLDKVIKVRNPWG
jgi:calpain-15